MLIVFAATLCTEVSWKDHISVDGFKPSTADLHSEALTTELVLSLYQADHATPLHDRSVDRNLRASPLVVWTIHTMHHTVQVVTPLRV